MQQKEPLYDLSELKTISRGNDLFIKKMVKVFCEQTPAMIKEMNFAYNEGNMEKLAAIAHKIRPSLDNLNINLLKQPIRDIESINQVKIENNQLIKMLGETEAVITKVIEMMKTEYPHY